MNHPKKHPGKIIGIRIYWALNKQKPRYEKLIINLNPLYKSIHEKEKL